MPHHGHPNNFFFFFFNRSLFPLFPFAVLMAIKQTLSFYILNDVIYILNSRHSINVWE